MPSKHYKTFASVDDLQRVIATGYQLKSNINALEQSAIPTSLYRPYKTTKHFLLTPSTESDLSSIEALVFGGMEDAENRLGIIVRGKEKLLGHNKHTLLFHSAKEKNLRFLDAYRWNIDKHFVSDEIQTLADTLWEHRFLTRDKSVMPLENFKPLTFFTYSVGTRMALMLEQALYMKFQATGFSDEHIQQYFDKMRRVSIGYAVDWGNAVDGQPYILSKNYISVNDMAPYYRQSFVDTCFKPLEGQKQTMPVHYSYENTAHIPPSIGEITVLPSGLVPETRKGKSNLYGHGFNSYVDAIDGLFTERLKLSEFAMEMGQQKA